MHLIEAIKANESKQFTAPGPRTIPVFAETPLDIPLTSIERQYLRQRFMQHTRHPSFIEMLQRGGTFINGKRIRSTRQWRARQRAKRMAFGLGMVPVPFKHMPHRCGPCCYKVDDDKYNARPAVLYTGQPIHANEWDDEGYCFRDDELYDKIIGKLLDWKDEKLTIEQFKQHIHDLHIVQCRPEYLGQFDAGDHYQDVLPEDGELPTAVQDKVDELNEVIKAQGPVSWYPGKERITFEDSYIAEIYQCYCKEWDERFAGKESA